MTSESFSHKIFMPEEIKKIVSEKKNIVLKRSEEEIAKSVNIIVN